MHRFLVQTDGGARGNPGPAAAAFILDQLPDQASTNQPVELASGAKYLGETTNNQAEYQALLLALDYLTEHYDLAELDLRLETDSQLMAEQLKGNYRVKHPELIPLFQTAQNQLQKLGRLTIVAIRREFNRRADALVNQELDRQAVK